MITMIDASQILLVAAITVMTVILTVIGIQLIFVLRDLRKLLIKVNSIVDAFEKVGVSVSSGYSEIVGFISGIKKLFFLLDLLAEKKKLKKQSGKK